MTQFTFTFLVPVFLAAVSYVIFRRSQRLSAPYPPGPRPKPIIGNGFDIPLKKSWIKYIEMADEYNSPLSPLFYSEPPMPDMPKLDGYPGDIIHLSVMDMHIVVLRTDEDITELFERRSAKYSSRMSNPIFSLVGMENITAFLPYGDTLRKQRRLLDEGLRKDVIPSYRDIQTEKIHLFLDQLLHEPAGFKEHCKTLGTSITMAVAFGYNLIPGHKDQYIELAEFAITTAQELLTPGRSLITVFPFLKHMPPWFPGAHTRRLCAQVKQAAIEYRNQPFDFVKRNMAAGTSKSCVLQRLLESHTDHNGLCEDEEIIKDAISTFYLGGVETMQTVAIDFILAMTLHPNAQRKAQDEIDRVVGKDRLPTPADRPSLPYVEALYREVLRWRPVTPLGFVHSSIEDDIYKGFYIPKGTIVLPNVWAVTRDEKRYPDPELFLPERFFTKEGTLNNDTISFMFGYGRRICPGRYLADSSLWLTIASVLATFNISKTKDEHGNEIAVDGEAFTDSLVMHPLPFKCSIVPRSQQAESLVLEAGLTAKHHL